MATVEKGITITFRGDTADFDDSISKVNKELKDTKSELKLLNKELKLDPTNIGKLEAKFKELKKEEKLLTEEIDAYKQAMKDLDPASEAFGEMDKKVRELEISLGYCQKAMEKMGGNEVSVALDAIAKKFENAGKKVNDMAKAFAPISGVAGGILGGAVKTASDFEASMSQVQATMGITKDTTSLLNGELVNTTDALANLAQEMGAKTAFSASEAGDALNYLALAGYNTQQMADVLPIVLNLASAGALGLASASDMVTDAMSALGLETSDAEVMVDQMAKTASSSNTSVAQLGEAILTIGATAKGLKGGTTELNTALGLLANNGIKGSEAGTKLRNIILSLQNPTDDASELMKELGVQVYDSEGKMRGLEEILGDLNKSMDGMKDSNKSAIISTLFNKADLASAQALLSNVGDAWTDLSGKIEDSAGSAELMAGTQLDNLNGQITILKSGLEAVAISLGNALLPTIKNVTSFIQRLVDKFNSLDEKTKTTIATILAVVASITPVLLVLGTTLSTIGKGIKVISDIIGFIWPIMQAIGSFLMTANPIGIVVAGLAILIPLAMVLYEKCEWFRNIINAIGSYLKDVFTGAVEKVSEAIGALCQWFKDTWSAVGDLWESFKQTEFMQTIIDMFNTLATAISTVVDWLKQAWEWFGSVLDRVGEFLSSGISSIASTVGGWFSSGGFGNGGAYQSGGYGTLEFATTINITNNGANLSSAQAQQFGRQIVEYVNDKLGRRI